MEENKRNKNTIRKISLKTDKILQETYIPYNNKDFHVHRHNKKEPHLHGSECEVINSALDLKRNERYYFTSDKTPVRVYINYENQQDNIRKETSSKELSQKFIKEASSLIFCKETRSFIPKAV